MQSSLCARQHLCSLTGPDRMQNSWDLMGLFRTWQDSNTPERNSCRKTKHCGRALAHNWHSATSLTFEVSKDTGHFAVRIQRFELFFLQHAMIIRLRLDQKGPRPADTYKNNTNIHVSLFAPQHSRDMKNRLCLGPNRFPTSCDATCAEEQNPAEVL